MPNPGPYFSVEFFHGHGQPFCLQHQGLGSDIGLIQGLMQAFVRVMQGYDVAGVLKLRQLYFAV